MSTQTIDLQKLKSTADSLHSMVANHNGTPSHNQMLQYLSQALFSKPYEEVKETLLKPDYIPVNKFICGYEHFLFVGDKCIYRGKKQLSDHKISALIKKEKNMKSWTQPDSFYWIDMPYLVDGKLINDPDIKPELQHVKQTARMMGFMDDNHLINILENKAQSVLINNIHIPYLLNSDWKTDLYEESFDNNNYQNIIWYAEAVANNEFYEWYFSLQDLNDAVYHENDDVWVVNGNIIKIIQ